MCSLLHIPQVTDSIRNIGETRLLGQQAILVICIGSKDHPRLTSEVAVMAIGDKLLGLMLLLAAGFIFVYYTIWVLVLVSSAS